MNITITGATGFIGRRLIERLGTGEHQLHVLSRHTNIRFGDTAVWTLGGDRFRIETPHGAREVDGFDRARELAHELARD